MRDPNSSLRTGDVISITPGVRYSKHVHHVVSSILAPFGTPVSERAPVPTEEERMEALRSHKLAKDERRGKLVGKERVAIKARTKEAVLAVPFEDGEADLERVPGEFEGVKKDGEAGRVWNQWKEGRLRKRLEIMTRGARKARKVLGEERVQNEGLEEMMKGVGELELDGDGPARGSVIPEAAGLKMYR